MTMPVAALDAGSKAVAWLWDKYGKALADKAAENLKKKWAEVQWVEAAQKYRARMLELHGTLRVLGKPEPVSLEGVFTDVFILDRPRTSWRFDIAQLYKNLDLEREQNERISGLRLITQPRSHRLFILGQPGAGKTTFLKYLTLQAAQGKLDKIPIFVGLNEWSESRLELPRFIERQFAICAFPDALAFIEYILKEGKALVLFDGLDEVRQEGTQRKKVIEDIREFNETYFESQMLVTCRIAATEYELSDRFTYVELADFTEDQMRVYAQKWFHDDTKKGRAFETEFFDKSEYRGLREMGRTPLLLAMLCLHFEETQTFPQRHVELYEEALDALLKKWDATRNIRRDDVYRRLSLGLKREMLTTLAAETFERGELFFQQERLAARIVAYLRTLPPTDVNEDIDGEVVLKAIEAQHGILVERAHRIHAFAHLSFQEYFTAKYVVERGSFMRLLTIERIQDRRWREVLLNTASLLYEADEFFMRFQNILDAGVQEDVELLALLHWANAKALPFTGEYNPNALRALYIYLALDLTYTRTRTHTRVLTLALDRARDLARVLDRTLNRALDRNRPHSRALHLTLDRDLAQALDRARTRARAHTTFPSGIILDICIVDAFYFAVVSDITHEFEDSTQHLPTFASYLRDVAKLARRVPAPEMVGALSCLKVPPPYAPQTDWDMFVNTVEALLIQRNLCHDFTLTRLSDTQVEKVANHLAATQLLVECLARARVSDRAGIEARILQPPEVADHEFGNE